MVSNTLTCTTGKEQHSFMHQVPAATPLWQCSLMEAIRLEHTENLSPSFFGNLKNIKTQSLHWNLHDLFSKRMINTLPASCPWRKTILFLRLVQTLNTWSEETVPRTCMKLSLDITHTQVPIKANFPPDFLTRTMAAYWIIIYFAFVSHGKRQLFWDLRAHPLDDIGFRYCITLSIYKISTEMAKS